MRDARYLGGKRETYSIVLDDEQEKGIRKLQRRLRRHELNFSETVRLLLMLAFRAAEENLVAGVPLREWVGEPARIEVADGSSTAS